MKAYYNIKQRSAEWDTLRCGSIGGTRFGQVISGKKNRLLYDLLNEKLNGYIDESDFIDDDMQFGIDNEPVARKLYSEQIGLKFVEIGLIKSELSNIHHSSPDGITETETDILEVKCTQNGAIHLQRFFEGTESLHMPQIINYFAVSDKIERVHWLSYCPYRLERKIVAYVYEREDFLSQIEKGRIEIMRIESNLTDYLQRFTF